MKIDQIVLTHMQALRYHLGLKSSMRIVRGGEVFYIESLRSQEFATVSNLFGTEKQIKVFCPAGIRL